MIARNPEQALQDALSLQRGADSGVAVVEPGEHRGTDERPVVDGCSSWGTLTSVSASAVRRLRSEQRLSAFARQNHQQQNAPQRPPFYVLAVEQYWRHVVPGYGLARLRCRQCGRDVVVPICLNSGRLLPVVQDVPLCRHGVVPDRLRAEGMRHALGCRAGPATRAAASGLPAGRARLMGGRHPAAHSCRRTQ